MKVSETTQKIYDGVSNILKENGVSLTKAQVYAVESMIETIEETTEKRCCELTESILEKNKAIMESMAGKVASNDVVSEATVQKVNEMVEARITQLKQELPAIMDYAKLKRLQECVESIKECVGYHADEQVEKVAAESAKMLHSTKSLIETQAKQISEKAASLSESSKTIQGLQEKVKQMQATIDAKEKQIVESTKKNKELLVSVSSLQKKVEESKKINENLEEKRKQESLRFYLEEKVSKYPQYEAGLLRKHFQNAKSKAEIDENFQKAVAMVQERRDAMRTVQAIPVAKAAPVAKVAAESTKKTTSGGETIVKESGEAAPSESMWDDSFVDIEMDSDVISNEEMLGYMSRL